MLEKENVMSTPKPEAQSDLRKTWYENRRRLEDNRYKKHLKKKSRRPAPSKLRRMSSVLELFLKASGLWQNGFERAERIVTNHYDLSFADLPKAFDGYRILHLSDLHLGLVAGSVAKLAAQIKTCTYDLCLLSGDYRNRLWGRFSNILALFEPLVAEINAPDGIYATLGNHDTCRMVAPLEILGLHVLTNQTVEIRRGADAILLTGIDDPHYYFTDQAVAALKTTPDQFKIVLVHTPELYRQAAQNRYRLYLCGHTHGGQICLPGGIPLATNTYTGHRFYRGLWRYGAMQGFTNQGCGTVDIPIRFFTQSEIALITLHAEKA